MSSKSRKLDTFKICFQYIRIFTYASISDLEKNTNNKADREIYQFYKNVIVNDINDKLVDLKERVKFSITSKIIIKKLFEMIIEEVKTIADKISTTDTLDQVVNLFDKNNIIYHMLIFAKSFDTQIFGKKLSNHKENENKMYILLSHLMIASNNRHILQDLSDLFVVLFKIIARDLSITIHYAAKIQYILQQSDIYRSIIFCGVNARYMNNLVVTINNIISDRKRSMEEKKIAKNIEKKEQLQNKQLSINIIDNTENNSYEDSARDEGSMLEEGSAIDE